MTEKAAHGADLIRQAVDSPVTINWSSDDKRSIDATIAQARLRERRRQMQLQRGGKARHERGKKNKRAAPPAKGDPAVREKIQQAQAARRQRERDLEEQRVFEVPGTDTEYDTVRLNLEDE